MIPAIDNYVYPKINGIICIFHEKIIPFIHKTEIRAKTIPACSKLNQLTYFVPVKALPFT